MEGQRLSTYWVTSFVGIGIVGLGGTGSYVLDFIAKTPVKEIRKLAMSTLECIVLSSQRQARSGGGSGIALGVVNQRFGRC